MGKNEILIEANSLVKRYGDFTAVDGINFQVRKGESFGFLGPNGAGKSTTMRIIAATLTRTSGEITILGKDPEKFGPEIKAHLGVVPQSDNLDQALTVEENLYIYGRYFGLSKNFIRPKIEELLEFAQLSDKRSVKVDALSGGMKRRLTIARALISEPEILMLDEPTTGLDPQARHILWDRLFRLKEQGVTLLITTHYMDEAERCHRVAYLAYGKLLAQGTVAEVIAGAGLSTWAVAGPDLAALALRLRPLAGIEQVVAFGTQLHVSGTDAAALERAIAPFQAEPHEWRRIPSSLEDVFIGLMDRAKDTYRA